jgi:aspartate oxidase
MENSTKTIKTTDIVIVGAGFAGSYLAHSLLSRGYNKILIIAPNKKTVSDKAYYNFRSRGIKQTSLKTSVIRAGQGKCNNQLVNVLVNNIDDELTRLNYLTEMKPSFLGASVSNPKMLLEKLRKILKNNRLYEEVVKIKKWKSGIIVETVQDIVHCKKIVFCGGGNRSRFSKKFQDEKVDHDIFELANNIGCRIEDLDKIMYHPFYSKGVCISSDNIFDFDIVDQDGQRLEKVCHLLRAHNAHHCFEEICREFKKTKKCFAVKGNKKIELEIEPHYTLGGIRINKHGQTNIKNVYALGECSFGMHGYGRIGGCSLSEIIVMTQIIAKKIITS